MKLCTEVWIPKGKIEFVMGQNPSTYFALIYTHVMHFQWQGLNTTLTRPVDRLWRLIAQMTSDGQKLPTKGLTKIL